MINYYYYRLACEAKGVCPLSRLRFEIGYSRFLRDCLNAGALISAAVDKKQRLRLTNRWKKLAQIAAYVHRGKLMAGEEGGELVPAGFGAALPTEQERVVMETPGAGRNRFYDLDSYVRPAPSIKPDEDGPQPGAGGTGVREPRRPIAPILIGAAARPLPNPLPEYFDAAV